MRPGPALYRALLSLLPREVREEYGAELAEVVEARWESVRRERGPWGRSLFWVREGRAVIRLALGTRLPRLGTGRGGDGVGAMGLDLRHAVRALRTRPLFTAVTVLTLGLGIGATTAVFSAVHAVLLRPLSYPDAGEIVAVVHENARTGEPGDGLSAGNARDLDVGSEELAAVAVAEPWSLDLLTEGRAHSLRGWAVSRAFFPIVGTEALHGRTLVADDYDEGAEPVVVLGHRAWTTRFGADPELVGRTVVLDGRATRVVGILPPDFRLPDEAAIWTPRTPRPWDDQTRDDDYMAGFGRLAPGATLEAAAAEVDRLALGLAERYPETNASTRFRLIPLHAHLMGHVRTPLLVLMGAVGVVLLIACANVAGLMLARGSERRREYALRAALGASTGQLARAVALEAAALATLGCLLGVGLAVAGSELIAALAPDDLPRIENLAVDGPVLLFAVAVAAVSAGLSALVPSLRLSRPDLRGMLADGRRGTGGGGRRGVAVRNRLVVAQVAAAVVLLIGAGLLMRSFGVLLSQELGFEVEDRLALQLFAYDYETPEARSAFVVRATEALRALPGVEGVALTSNLPGATDRALASIDIDLPVRIEDRVLPPEAEPPRAYAQGVSPGYFDILEIPLLAGRDLLPSDRGDAPLVALVNEAFVRRHLAGVDPLGERVVVGSGDGARAWEIVGVVADVRPGGPESLPRPEVYRPLAQAGSGSLTFVLETAGNAPGLTRPALDAIWEVNPHQSVWGAATLESLLADWLRERRFNLLLLGGLAGLALVLAAVGIYGLLSYSVERRVRELGVRKALGGRPADILAMVLREAAAVAGLGVVLGLVAALVSTRVLRGMLYGVGPMDPLTFVVLPLAVLAVACLAALAPAARAVRADPMVALRRG